MATTLRKLYPDDWQTKRYDTLLVHKTTFDALTAGKTSAADLQTAWQPDLAKFLERRKAALLYAE